MIRMALTNRRELEVWRRRALTAENQLRTQDLRLAASMTENARLHQIMLASDLLVKDDCRDMFNPWEVFS